MQKRKDEFRHKPNRIFTDNVFLVCPQYDTSEKELFHRNGYRNPQGNLIKFLQNDDIITHRLDLKVNMPKKLGQFTKDCYGTELKLGQEMKRPAFNQNNRE